MLRVETGADHVCRVTLERPEAKNALTVEMRDQLVEAVRAARADAGVRARGSVAYGSQQVRRSTPQPRRG